MIELQQFGWNWVTAGFFGAMITSFLGFWGVLRQNRLIWQRRSGGSVPVTLFTYGTLFFASGFVYGLSISSLALLVAGLRVLLHLPVLIGLWKFKGFKPWETVSALIFLLVLIILIILPHKDELYFAISLGAVLSCIPQPLEMLINRSRGAVSVGFLWVTCIGVTFWLIYSIALGNWVLSIINPLFLFFTIASLIVWYVLPPAEKISSKKT